MSNDIQARVQRCRRALSKKGFALHKSRVRRWSEKNQGGFMIMTEVFDRCHIVAGEHYDLTLEDVENYIEWLKR